MPAVKRTLFRFRSKDAVSAGDAHVTKDGGAEHRTGVEIPEISLTVDSPDASERDEEGNDGPSLPKLWVGLAAASLGGLAAAAYKLLRYRKAVKEAKKDEPWRHDEEERWSPIETGTASLVGLLFIIVVNAVGKRFERDYPVEYSE